MQINLSTRITLMVAAVTLFAFVAFAMIIHRSTSRVFVEAQYDIDVNQRADASQLPNVVPAVEEAYSVDGWKEVRKLASSPKALNIKPRFIVVDNQLNVQAATYPSLDGISVSKLVNENYFLSINQVGSDNESVLELEIPWAWPVQTDGVAFGKVMVLPTPVDPVIGEEFAAQVWSTAAISLAATLAISMLVTFLIVRHSLKPAARLTAAARQLNSGNIPNQLKVEGDREFRSLIEAFNSATRSLAETDELRKQLIADIAHELRTPLTNIKGQLEAAQAGLLTNDDELRTTLGNETKLLERLVEDFQQLSLSDAGQLEIRPQTLPLAMLLQDVLAPFLKNTTAKLRLDIRESFKIRADEGRMRQVLGNLMENSVRHGPNDLIVTVSAERTGQHIVVSFSDNGPGIAKADQPRIFDRFFRAEKSRNRLTGGSGLGLPIAKALVEAMDGSICFVSTNGTGTTFKIKLPSAVGA